jgi:hypothetical protein
MRKFEFLNYTVDGKQQICYQNPIQQMQSLCGLVFHKFAYTKTTKPVNCPDCLAIIRECQEIKFDWQDSLGQRPDEFRKTKPDPNTESLLHECCLALGWSGGTRAQVLQVLRTTRQLVFDRVSSELNGEYEDFKKDLTVLDNLIRKCQ